MKNIYEILDEFEQAKNKKQRIEVLKNNMSQVLQDVLVVTYHPDAQWLVTEMPHNYIPPDTLPGVSFSHIGTEMKRLYLFKKGHPSAESLSPKRREEILIQILESLEPREAEVVIGIFKKDLGVKGLTYDFVKECFPNLLP